jgi:dihydropteroate synthase
MGALSEREATMIFRAGDRQFDLTHDLLLMGILNVTPDSFSEQGANFDHETAVQAGIAMAANGADILDIGGESTRPGAATVTEEEEAGRVVPVIARLRQQTNLPISIDTSKAAVAAAAIVAGANIINDISGFHRDPDMAAVAAKSGVGCIIMHMRGTPATMQQFTEYRDMVGEINDYFAEAIDRLTAVGVDRECICLDPGIGFSKTVKQNLELINRLSELVARHDRPLLLGPSRKSFIGKTLDIEDPQERVWGTAAAIACGILRGARILRVHDVQEMGQVSDLALAIANSTETPEEAQSA